MLQTIAVVLVIATAAAAGGGGDGFEGCPEGHFMCNSSAVCVPQVKICDEVPECADGSDEWDCDDVYFSNYWDHLFRKRPSAEKNYSDAVCYAEYNGTCHCRLRDILCPNRNLLTAPADLPHEGVDFLDLSGNRFAVLSPQTLKGLPFDLKSLVLKHCEIAELKEYTFVNLQLLESLYLDNNALEKFPANSFSKHNELQVLIVSRNRLKQIEGRAFATLSKLYELDLSYNQLEGVERTTFEPLISLDLLYLNGNRIRHVSATSFPALPITTLSLAGNRLEELPKDTFSKLTALEHLYLSDNRIEFIVGGVFGNLSRLQGLNLNGNRIAKIDTGALDDARNLTSLYLKKNPFRTLDKRVLGRLKNLRYIYFDRFEMCLAAPLVRVCEPRGDGISSREHLLDNKILRASVWIMGGVGCTGNLMVLLGRLLTPHTNVIHSLYIRNLALSDLLMSIYLFTIAGVDFYFRGLYIQHEYRWRHSSLCNLCGFLNTLSCTSSVFILSLVTWDRLISVTKPLTRRQTSPRIAALTVIMLWLLSVILALLPLTGIARNYFGNEFYGGNGVCLSLHIHEPFAKGWEYSAAMFIAINTVALIFICYAYVRMMHEIKISRVSCRSTRQANECGKVTHRFGLIILTDCGCWVPIVAVKIAALMGANIPETLYGWLAVFILPINSAINPILYTLSTTVFKKQIRKTIGSFMPKHQQAEPQNSESGFSLSFGVFPIGGSNRRFLASRATQSSNSKNSLRRPTAV